MEAYLGIDEITGVLFQRLKGKGCKIHGDGSANQSELKQECDFILFHNLFCIRRVKKKTIMKYSTTNENPICLEYKWQTGEDTLDE